MCAVEQLLLPGKVIVRRPWNIPQLPLRPHKFGLHAMLHRRKRLLHAGERRARHQPLRCAFVIDVAHQVECVLVKTHPQMNPMFFNAVPVCLVSPTGALATQAPSKGIHRNLVSLLPIGLRGQLQRCTQRGDATAQDSYLLHSRLRAPSNMSVNLDDQQAHLLVPAIALHHDSGLAV